VTNDDVLFRHRVKLFARGREVGVTQACREFGYHRSSYYRLRHQVLRQGLEMLRPRERRRPRMPNQVPPWLEEQVIAFALGHPGLGPRRIAAQLRQPMWGGLVISPSGVYNVLGRHGLRTRGLRLSLVAGYAAPPEPEPPPRLAPGHLEANVPGELVQLDCFHIGRLTGTKGRVWQHTAIDVASSFTWAEIHVTPLNPAARHTSALARRVAAELAAAGWRLQAVSTDNGSEFPLPGVPPGRGGHRCPSPLHPCRPAPVQRLRRARPADHPGGVLAAQLRPLPGPQGHRPPASYTTHPQTAASASG
jgi:hypothetical protein